MAAISGAGKGIQIVVGADYKDKDLKRAQRDLDGLKRKAAETQGPMAALGSKMRSMVGPAMIAAGAAAAGFAVKLGVDAVQGAIAEQQEIAKLQQALDNVGQSFAMPEVDAFISKLQMATGVSDSELRPAFQTLVTATGDVAQAMDLMNLAMDISAGTGKDLSSVTAALAKASGGSFTALSKLTMGAISPAILATKDLDQVTAALADKFGGQAEAAAKTWAGSIKRIEQAAGELSDSFGAGFLSAFDDASGSVDGLVDSLVQLQPFMQDLGQTVGENIETVIGLVNTVRDLKSSLDGLPFPEWTKGTTNFDGAIFNLADTMRKGIQLYDVWSRANNTAAVETADATTAVNDFNDALGFGGGTFGAVAQAMGPWMEGIGSTIGIVSDMADELGRLNVQMGIFNGLLDERDAARSYQSAIDDLQESLKENGKSFRISTDAGRKNQAALDDIFTSAMQVADGQSTVAEKAAVMQAAAAEANDVLAAMGVPASTRQKLLGPFDELIGRMAQGKVSKAELQAAIDSLKGKTVTASVETGMAQANVTALRESMAGVTSKAVTITVNLAGHGLSVDQNHNGVPDVLEASGGYITGPGGPTTDSIPARLSNGEFVIRAASVDKFGVGFFDMLNRGVNPIPPVAISPKSDTPSGGFVINGGITVVAPPSEKAEETLPRALRRAAFLAGV